MRTHEPEPNPEPGERPPAPRPGRQLDRAPSERYRPGADTRATASGLSAGNRKRRAIGSAVCVAGVGAVILTIILGGLASTGGTFAVTAFASVAIGLLVSTAAVPDGRSTTAALRTPTPRPTAAQLRPAAPLRRDQAIRMASAIGVGMIIATGAGVWVLGRIEGGVMDPLTYLWTTFGFGLPAQAVVALVAAAWGAASGPIRWRS